MSGRKVFTFVFLLTASTVAFSGKASLIDEAIEASQGLWKFISRNSDEAIDVAGSLGQFLLSQALASPENLDPFTSIVGPGGAIIQFRPLNEREVNKLPENLQVHEIMVGEYSEFYVGKDCLDFVYSDVLSESIVSTIEQYSGVQFPNRYNAALSVVNALADIIPTKFLMVVSADNAVVMYSQSYCQWPSYIASNVGISVMFPETETASARTVKVDFLR